MRASSFSRKEGSKIRSTDHQPTGYTYYTIVFTTLDMLARTPSWLNHRMVGRTINFSDSYFGTPSLTYQEQTLLYSNVEKALSTTQDLPYQKGVKKDIDKGFQICVTKT